VRVVARLGAPCAGGGAVVGFVAPVGAHCAGGCGLGVECGFDWRTAVGWGW